MDDLKINQTVNNRSYYKKNQAGFSLIELMIVVTIIGLLAAVAIPRYQTYVKKTALTNALGQLSAKKVDIEYIIAEQGQFPNSLDLSEGENIEIINPQGLTGEIQLNIPDGPAKGVQTKLRRETDGKWQCVIQGESINQAALPSQCQLAQVNN